MEPTDSSSNPQRPFIIGVCGGSGSGKTSLIRNIKESFTKEEVCIISQDDYYRPREEQKIDDHGVRNFDRPKSILDKELADDLKALIEGRAIERLEYTFNNEKATPDKITLAPAPVIVVEGLFVFHFKKIRKLLDLRVYVHAKENLKVIRRIRRDQIERNYSLDDVLYRYQHHVLPAFEKYIEPYKNRAHLIVNNNESMDRGLEVIVGFVQSKVRS